MDNQVDIQEVLKYLREIIGQQAIDNAVLRAQLATKEQTNGLEPSK